MDSKALTIADLYPGFRLRGLLPDWATILVAIDPLDESMVGLFFRGNAAESSARIVTQSDVGDFELARASDDQEALPFDRDSSEFRLAAEAPRIKHAYRGRRVFDEYSCFIARMDQFSLNQDLMEWLFDAAWDVAVVEEVHRMLAHYSSSEGEVQATKRFNPVKLFSKRAHNFLWMIATSHARCVAPCLNIVYQLPDDKQKLRYLNQKRGERKLSEQFRSAAAFPEGERDE